MRELFFTIALVFTFILPVFTQVIDPANIYAFEYNGKTYEIVRENKTWVNAAAAAVVRGGYLAEINSQAEQDALFAELQNANIINDNTVAQDGGGASYVWLGGNDINTEGQWIWDGGNDGNSTQFWQGKADGNAVNGAYTNWGNEPDDFNNNQDGLGLALTQWPFDGHLGSAGQWNDVAHTNTLYFIIEHNGILPIELISFSGEQQGSQVALKWSTATQVNSKSFVLERAQDAVKFEKIATIEVAGDSDVKVDYRYMDENPMAGINYYRLKVIDFDLRTEYFPIINVDFNTATNVEVYPNPVRDVLKLKESGEGLIFMLYDLNGQLILEKKISSQEINLSFLENGAYYYLVKDKLGVVLQQDKLVKF